MSGSFPPLQLRGPSAETTMGLLRGTAASPRPRIDRSRRARSRPRTHARIRAAPETATSRLPLRRRLPPGRVSRKSGGVDIALVSSRPPPRRCIVNAHGIDPTPSRRTRQRNRARAPRREIKSARAKVLAAPPRERGVARVSARGSDRMQQEIEAHPRPPRGGTATSPATDALGGATRAATARSRPPALARGSTDGGPVRGPRSQIDSVTTVDPRDCQAHARHGKAADGELAKATRWWCWPTTRGHRSTSAAWAAEGGHSYRRGTGKRTAASDEHTLVNGRSGPPSSPRLLRQVHHRLERIGPFASSSA